MSAEQRCGTCKWFLRSANRTWCLAPIPQYLHYLAPRLNALDDGVVHEGYGTACPCWCVPDTAPQTARMAAGDAGQMEGFR